MAASLPLAKQTVKPALFHPPPSADHEVNVMIGGFW
jgi:hypothetical protein